MEWKAVPIIENNRFDISYFRNNPLPFYTLAHELAPGKFRPTLAHCFVRLLADKGLLLKVFTQNIDCLEREAGVPENLIVEAHGSFANHSCIECRAQYPDDLMRKAIEDTRVPYCTEAKCGGLVKPNIVFFGEQLPEAFHSNRTLPSKADLCIIMGTSLSVQPFASLPAMCSDGVPRLLINSERVGGLGSRADDVLVLGDCDDGVRKLARALQWHNDLEKLWQKSQFTVSDEPDAERTRDEALEDEIAKITTEVDRALKIGEDQTRWLETHLQEKHMSEGQDLSSGAHSTTDDKSTELTAPRVAEIHAYSSIPHDKDRAADIAGDERRIREETDPQSLKSEPVPNEAATPTIKSSPS